MSEFDELERLRDEIEYLKQKLFWRWVFFLYGVGLGAVIMGGAWFCQWIKAL